MPSFQDRNLTHIKNETFYIGVRDEARSGQRDLKKWESKKWDNGSQRKFN